MNGDTAFKCREGLAAAASAGRMEGRAEQVDQMMVWVIERPRKKVNGPEDGSAQGEPRRQLSVGITVLQEGAAGEGPSVCTVLFALYCWSSLHGFVQPCMLYWTVDAFKNQQRESCEGSSGILE